jgi:hypothetical protein
LERTALPVPTNSNIAATVIALAGVGVVALPTGIFASAFSEELRERERLRHQHAVAQEIAQDVVDELVDIANPDGKPLEPP